MKKEKQRKAALFLVICMVLSMFNGIPVQAEELDETETGSGLQFWWWHTETETGVDEYGDDYVAEEYIWDDVKEPNEDGTYGSDPRKLNLYITVNDAPVEKITVSYYEENGLEDVMDDDSNIQPTWTHTANCILENPGFFVNILAQNGKDAEIGQGTYKISAGGYDSFWGVGLPPIAFFSGTEYTVANYITDDFVYEKGDVVYVIPNPDIKGIDYRINAEEDAYIEVGSEESEGSINDTNPVKVTFTDAAKGNFNLWVDGNITWNENTDEEDSWEYTDSWLWCSEKSVGLVAAYAHSEYEYYDEDKEEDVYTYCLDSDYWKYENPWINKDQMLYLGYREDVENEPTPVDLDNISIQFNGEENVDFEPAGEPGYVTVNIGRVGEYTITYNNAGNTSTVTLDACFPSIGFYTGTEINDGEYYLQNVSYERGKGGKVFYIVPDLLTDDQGNNGRSISYTVSLENENYVTLEKQNGDDWEPVAAEDEITDVPVRVTVSAAAENDFELQVAGNVTDYYYDGDGNLQSSDDSWSDENSIWINEAMIGLVTSWDWHWNDKDVPEFNENVWYAKEIWVDLNGFDGYFGYRESEEEAATPVTLTLSNITFEDGTEDISDLVEIEDIGVPGFYRFSFNETGTYKVTYQGSSIVMHVEWSPIGFYSLQEATPENMIDWYSLWKSDNDIAANKVYLYIGDRELYDSSKHESEYYTEENYAFELTLLEWGEEGHETHLYFDTNGNPVEDTDAKYKGEDYLSVDSLGDGWYSLQFKTNALEITGENDETWEANGFMFCALTTETWVNEEGETEYGETSDSWISGNYQTPGLLSVYPEGDEDNIGTGDSALYVGGAIYPYYNTLHFGKYTVNDDGTVSYDEIQNVSDMTVQRMALDSTTGEQTGWTSASKGKDFECKLNESAGIDFAFYYQNDYKISFGNDSVIVHPYMGTVEFFNTPVRPGDPEKITNLIQDITVNEGKGGTVYALAWVDDDGYAVKPNNMEFRTLVEGEEVEGYIKKGEEIRDESRTVIGYAIEITDQAKEDFELIVEAPCNDKEEAGVVKKSIDVNVNKMQLRIDKAPEKTIYMEGETFDPTGMVVMTYYDDDTAETDEIITDYEMTPSKDVKLTTANTTVTITYSGMTAVQPITVKAATVPETPATPTEATPTEATPTEAPAVHKGTPIEDEKNSDGSYTVSSSDSANPTVEYKAPKNKNAKTAKIPDTIEKDGVTYKVTSVAPNAFKGNKKVTKVTIGNNITTIGKNAFSGCAKLKTVTIGKNVTTIGASAFKGCSALTKVTIPAKTTKIGKDAFNGCKKLKTVTIGKNVTMIEANAFKGCSSLTKITLPAKTTKIGKNAFSGCKNLKTITIKSTKIKSFTKGAFNGLSKDVVIKVPKKKKAAYATLLKKAGFKGTVK